MNNTYAGFFFVNLTEQKFKIFSSKFKNVLLIFELCDKQKKSKFYK